MMIDAMVKNGKGVHAWMITNATESYKYPVQKSLIKIISKQTPRKAEISGIVDMS